MKCYCRTYHTLIVKTLGLGGRKSPAQTILILLVESGLIFLGFQVSRFCIYLARMHAQDPQLYLRFEDSVLRCRFR